MNYYDDENNIIDLFRHIPFKKMYFLNGSFGLVNLVFSLRYGYSNWKNNTRSQDPPDFYNSFQKTMIEVMKFDDYESGTNSPNAIESKKIKELNNTRRLNGLPVFDQKELKIIYVPDLSNSSENNLAIYYENFNRIVGKHAQKIKTYKANHPNYKLCFLLFDESPAYVEMKEKNTKEYKPGEVIKGVRYYYALMDKTYMDTVVSLDIDFLIWMTPFKQTSVYSPDVGIFDAFLLDVNKAKKKPIKTIDYNYDNIICLEINS